MPSAKTIVLLAEDSDDIRALMKFILERKGYQVMEAENGQQVVEIAQRVKPNLILMDLSMPVVDGWEATRQLRRMEEMQSVPIIGLSAHCEGKWYEEAIEAGCSECIQKPAEEPVLDEIFSRFLKP